MRATPASSVMSAVSDTMSAPACSATNSSRRSWLTSTAIDASAFAGDARGGGAADARTGAGHDHGLPGEAALIDPLGPLAQRDGGAAPRRSAPQPRAGAAPRRRRARRRRPRDGSRSSSISCVNAPRLIFTRRLIASRLTGLNTSGDWPPWASMSVRMALPTGSSSQVGDRGVGGERRVVPMMSSFLPDNVSGTRLHPCRPPARRPDGRIAAPPPGPSNRAALIAAAREVYAADGTRARRSAPSPSAPASGRAACTATSPTARRSPSPCSRRTSSISRSSPHPTDRTIDDLLDRVVAQAMVVDGLHRAHRPPTCTIRGSRRSASASATSSARLLARERALGHVGAHVEVEDVMMATGMLADRARAGRSRPAARCRASRAGAVPRGVRATLTHPGGVRR